MSNSLSRYLLASSTTDAVFGEAIGRDRSMVSKLRRGIIKPSLDLAATIEEVTGGSVRMQDWASVRVESEAEDHQAGSSQIPPVASSGTCVQPSPYREQAA